MSFNDDYTRVMSRKMGENITREWDEDPFAPELFDALNLHRADPVRGLTALLDIAQGGSRLAMCYLGQKYMDDNKETELGLKWLAKSSAEGSIEGKYILSYHFLKQNQIKEALELHEELSNLGYSPAQYRIARIYYLGYGDVSRDMKLAKFYYGLAAGNGHVPSGFRMAYLRMQEGGIFNILAGIGVWLSWFLRLVPLAVTYRNSDRLRGTMHETR